MRIDRVCIYGGGAGRAVTANIYVSFELRDRYRRTLAGVYRIDAKTLPAKNNDGDLYWIHLSQNNVK